ncbi:MAG: tetratricopeptide repeat protein [Dethiobacter sp.]|nr:tetratricopeptide repeat protein [Dethiobacter sp.]
MKSSREQRAANRYKVVPFEREAGYYLQKGMTYYQKNKLNKALMHFRKAVEVEPKNPYNHYNLACLLSKLGRLKEANRIFHHIILDLDNTLADCYFLLAINYGLLEDMNKSREYLQRYLDADPEGDMVFEAMELLDALEDDMAPGDLPAYAEKDLVLEEILRSESPEELSSMFSGSTGFRQALSNRLYHGSDEFKENILRFYGTQGGEAACRALQDFIKNPWIKERIRQLALLELKNMGQGGTVQVFNDGELKSMDLDSYPVKTPVWREEWQQVMDCAMENMRRSDCYDEGFFDDIQAIWLDYINSVYPDVPRIAKYETWAAALEYSLARFHFLNLTQKELAQEYGVSAGSVSNRFKEINATLNIDHKAYQNMISYLKRDK